MSCVDIATLATTSGRSTESKTKLSCGGTTTDTDGGRVDEPMDVSRTQKNDVGGPGGGGNETTMIATAVLFALSVDLERRPQCPRCNNDGRSCALRQRQSLQQLIAFRKRNTRAPGRALAVGPRCR